MYVGKLVFAPRPPVVILPTKAILPSWDSATEVPRTAFPTASRRIVVHPRSGLSDVSADANGTIIEAECEGGAIETHPSRTPPGWTSRCAKSSAV
jgi:hypothetical protein